MKTLNGELNWDAIKLVVFDVDGTLYDQRGLRLCMLREMLVFAFKKRQVTFIKILRTYRRIREELGDELHKNFEQELITRTAIMVGCTEEMVQSIAEEWLEQRPLRHLIRYRYAALPELFRSLRAHGKLIGILSDYPALAKLKAMQLDADFIVCATDEDIGVLKPHPKGLQVIMARATAKPAETILIGDRPERDGLAAKSANVRALIRSRKSSAEWHTFDRYDSPLFLIAGV